MSAALELVGIIAGLSAYHNKRYCYPSQAWLKRRWGGVTGHSRSLRTLNRHLAALEAGGWIKRTVRHRHQEGAGWCFRSTMYTLTARAWRWLGSLRGGGAHKRRVLPCAISGKQYNPLGLNNQAPGREGTGPPPSNNVSAFLAEARNLLLPKK